MKHEALREALVDYLAERGYLSDLRVRQAISDVPRHLFVEASPVEAYSDQALSLKEQDGKVISTISQPSVVAHMLEELNTLEGQKVLEIGTGMGYNAALLSELVGPQGLVVTVEYDQELAKKAGLNLASYQNVAAVHGDGRNGYAAQAPYDRIIVTAKASDIYPAWQEQLVMQGIMLVPLEYFSRFTRLIKLKRTEKGFEGGFGWAVNFVPMAGEGATEVVELDEVASMLANRDLSYKEMDAFLFYYFCSGEKPKAAMESWLQLGCPKPEDFYLNTSHGTMRLSFASMELGMSISNIL